MKWSVVCGAANTGPVRLNRIRTGLRKAVGQHNLPLTFEVKMSGNVLVLHVPFSHRSVLSSALIISVHGFMWSTGKMDKMDMADLRIN